MSTLLINKENDKAEELLFKESDNLELGKALHLLLNVPQLVFEKACRSTINPLLTQSPVHSAISSIENHLKSHENGYRTVYDSLKEKILKKSSSALALKIACHFYSDKDKSILQHELLMKNDVRSQLVAVLLLAHIIKSHKSNNKEFVPCLVLVCENQRKPTLLAYTACETCLDCIESLNDRTNNHNNNNNNENSNKITEMGTNIRDKDNICLDQLKKIVHTVKEWRGSLGQLEDDAFSAINVFLNSMDDHVEEDAWKLFIKFFRPRPILLEKPLSEKKFHALFNEISSSSSLVSAIKLILFVLFQKSHIEQNLTPENKAVIQSEYKNMVQNITSTGHALLPALLAHLPTLFDLKTISDSPSIVSSLLDQPVTHSNVAMMKLMIVSHFDAAKDKIISRALQGADQSRGLIESTIQEQGNSNIVSEIADILLLSIKQSIIACELVIQCLPYLDLCEYIYKLIRLQYNEDSPKEKTTCMALVSKALLLDETNQTILIYIDMIRAIFYNKGILPFYLPRIPLLDQLRPSQLPIINTPDFVFPNEQEAYKFASSLLGSVELWSRRANPTMLKHGLVLLLNKCFGTALDTILVDTWRYLSFAISRHHNSLIWTVMDGCLQRIKSPLDENNNNEKEALLLKLNPLLILQTIQKDAFNEISLTKNQIHFVKEKMMRIGIDASQFLKSSEAPIERDLTKSLLDALLSRALNDEYQHESIQKLSISLLEKIYCL